jgi:hypothetical protein
MPTLQGLVLHIRRSSKAITWLHIKVHTETTIDQLAEVICKKDALNKTTFELIRYSLKAGDSVRLEIGAIEQIENANLYHAKECEIIKKRCEKTSFLPIPPPQKKINVAKGEVCKFWVNSSRCHYGSECNYEHPVGPYLKTAKEMWKNERKSSRDLLSDPNDPHLHNKASHGQRGDIFCEFLLNTFSDFTKVIDVAGGRGANSINLFIQRQISTILVDPRQDCLRPTKSQFKQLKKLGLEFKGIHLKLEFPTESIGTDSSLLFGMHPDQATEPIIDYALLNNISFAVVPCCVFARENPSRIINGNPVVSYEDYINYLMKKDKRIQKCFLKFDGRNQCLFLKTNDFK